jgi:hypothetical protein
MSEGYKMYVKARLRWQAENIPSATDNHWYSPDDIDGAYILAASEEEVTIMLPSGKKATVFADDIEAC